MLFFNLKHGALFILYGTENAKHIIFQWWMNAPTQYIVAVGVNIYYLDPAAIKLYLGNIKSNLTRPVWQPNCLWRTVVKHGTCHHKSSLTVCLLLFNCLCQTYMGQRSVLWIWLWKDLANQRRHYMCNVFFHWLRKNFTQAWSDNGTELAHHLSYICTKTQQGMPSTPTTSTTAKPLI